MNTPVEISVEEALARMSLSDPIEVWFEPDTDTGETQVATVERAGLAETLRQTQLFESGKHGQESDMGINVNFIHKTRGHGILFIKTRPECRQSDEQLSESLKRGHAANIFSRVPA